ncbi:hypothetical protein KPL71_021954 [Citrus sinensis]|uniref:Uncharacterized protein n=1 Tax=Citrus sinensis TaxID=2711 RepID=A0ACB8JLI6_CITSI|nr:hypothetical protein KPL71_021954 [Citrus sinensis]
MANNKERIENLEARLGGLQDGMQQMEIGINQKLHQLEETIDHDPTKWFAKVSQFFEYQGTTEAQKIALASFHLEGEANQWWQWLRRAYQEEGSLVTWETFADELWARFGPTECEDCDEALSRKEFERLGNRVHGWTQKALMGTFMGGLKPEISEDIPMFKPRTLKEAISLARMKDDQLSRQKKFLLPPMESPTTGPVKRLTWEEMKRRRA